MVAVRSPCSRFSPDTKLPDPPAPWGQVAHDRCGIVVVILLVLRLHHRRPTTSAASTPTSTSTGSTACSWPSSPPSASPSAAFLKSQEGDDDTGLDVGPRHPVLIHDSRPVPRCEAGHRRVEREGGVDAAAAAAAGAAGRLGRAGRRGRRPDRRLPRRAANRFDGAGDGLGLGLLHLGPDQQVGLGRVRQVRRLRQHRRRGRRRAGGSRRSRRRPGVDAGHGAVGHVGGPIGVERRAGRPGPPRR